MLKVFTFIPWNLLVCAVWYYIRLGKHLVLDFGTPSGLAFLCFALFALGVEFIKSADVGLAAFSWDLFFALGTLMVAVYTMTLVDQGRALTVPDMIIFGLLVFDAFVSPINAFRTAVRNVVHSPY